MKLSVGDKAPAFSLLDQDGKEHSLEHHLGKWMLIYFYPKDDTAGCTKEACAIRDSLPDFQALKVTVFGISVDSVESHKRFAEKYGLPFTLLSDEQKKTVNDYGVWGLKKFMGREFEGTMRTSFLIDPAGKIAKIYEKVNPVGHAEEVLKDLGELAK